MTFLPIVARELRVTARRRATFWVRTMVASIAIAVGTFLYLANLASPPPTIAQRIFLGLIAISMFFCLYAGRYSTADCLSEERRQGTLGLLFLTDLKGYDIVLGKLAATSLNGFYCLLAVFPVLAVPLLLGGITQGQFWRVILVLAVTFVFSLSVGMFVSALSRDTRKAMGSNLLVLLLIVGIPGACEGLLAYFVPNHSFHPGLLISCPLYTLYLCDDSRYTLQPAFYWQSVAVLHWITWILLGLASWAVKHSWQDKPSSRGWFSWRTIANWLKFGPASKRAVYRRRLLDTNPFYWLAARSKFKPYHVWAVLLLISGWWVWARFFIGTLWLDQRTSGTNLATAVMLNVALKLWLGMEASRQLAEERQGGSFELLLSTPLGFGEIFRGQLLALRRQFLWPVLVSAVVVVGFMIEAVHHSPIDRNLLTELWLGGILMFVLDVSALYWLAMYCAMTTASPNQAAVSSIVRVVIAPAVVFAAIVVLGNLYAFFAGRPGPEPGFYMFWWFSLGLAADLTYGILARRRLLLGFRQLACQGLAKKAS